MGTKLLLINDGVEAVGVGATAKTTRVVVGGTVAGTTASTVAAAVICGTVGTAGQGMFMAVHQSLNDATAAASRTPQL